MSTLPNDQRAAVRPPGDDRADSPRARRARRKAQTRRLVFRELTEIAVRQGNPLRLGISTADALQECLDRAVSIWRFAQSQLDAVVMDSSDEPVADVEYVDPNTGDTILVAQTEGFWEITEGPNGSRTVIPHRWYTLEREARRDVEQLAGMMTQLGIAERSVQIQEAMALMVAAQVRDAALEAGIDPDQVRALGAALRDRLERARASVAHPKSPSARGSQDQVTSQSVGSMGPGHGRTSH